MENFKRLRLTDDDSPCGEYSYEMMIRHREKAGMLKKVANKIDGK